MRERWRRGVLGLGLSGVLVALTLVIVGAATGYDGNASSVDEGVSGQPALSRWDGRCREHQDREQRLAAG